MSTPDGKQDALEWVKENREQVEDLAESDLRSADGVRKLLNYIDSDESEAAEFGALSPPTFHTRAEAEQKAREVRETLAGEHNENDENEDEKR